MNGYQQKRDAGRVSFLFLAYLRRFFVNRVYTIKAASIIATNPIFLAASGVIPNNIQRFETKLFVSSAIKIKNIGRHKLYPLIQRPTRPYHLLSFL
jgi:hypothetical protein